MVADVVEIHRLGDPVEVVEPPRERREIGIVRDPADVALEMAVIDRIEADQRGPQPDIRLGEPPADQPLLPLQPLLQRVELGEQRHHRRLIGMLRGRETGLVNSVVDAVVDLLVDRIDLVAMRLRIEIEIVRAAVIEGAAQHAEDIRALIVDDGAGLLVPQHRHGDMARIIGFRRGVDLVQIARAHQRFGGDALTLAERPAAFLHPPVDVDQLDRPGQPLEMPRGIGAVRPGAGKADIEPVAPRLGYETAVPGGAGAAVGSDPVAKRTLVALEGAAVLVVIVPFVVPLAVFQKTHVEPLLVSFVDPAKRRPKRSAILFVMASRRRRRGNPGTPMPANCAAVLARDGPPWIAASLRSSQ